MTEPEAGHLKIVSAPRLPVAVLLELHQLCNSILSSPDVAIHEGDRDETTADVASGLIRTDRPDRKPTAHGLAPERDCSTADLELDPLCLRAFLRHQPQKVRVS